MRKRTLESIITSSLSKQGDVVLNISVHIGFEGVELGKAIGPKDIIFFLSPKMSVAILLSKIYTSTIFRIFRRSFP